ncbi:collectin-10 [Elysia marginata]|uniref:Collectin-10 n=1 Tax=Elysia marginata TaxID=1093978 RepID=A0AAV4GUP8_9GAST|nr:collectin-10 [Elysia marginata]
MSKLHVAVISLLLFVSIATAANRTLENSCPDGVLSTTYRTYLKLYGDSCFQFALNKERIYQEASSECRYHGGTLALPKTQHLNNIITRMLIYYYGETKPVWIGLHDMHEETRFVWEDNTRMQWNNFAKGNGPDNNWFTRGVEDCAALDPMDDGLWHDFQCESNFVSFVTGSASKKPYICQYTLDLVEDQDDKGQGANNRSANYGSANNSRVNQGSANNSPANHGSAKQRYSQQRISKIKYLISKIWNNKLKIKPTVGVQTLRVIRTVGWMAAKEMTTVFISAVSCNQIYQKVFRLEK